MIYGRDVPGGADPFATLKTDALDPADGFVISGVNAAQQAGSSVSNAGDVNGDGIDDIIIGAQGDGSGGAYAGGAYVLFGRDVPGGAPAFSGIDLASLSPDDGFFIQGTITSEAGADVSSAGDVNGDGIDDILVGAYRGAEAFVIFGRDVAGGDTPFSTIDLSALWFDEGFAIRSQVGGNYLGYAVSGAGDVNADGIDDLVVGAREAETGSGAVFVVYGRDAARGDMFFGDIFIEEIDATVGMSILGLPDSLFGISVSSAGDINGDGGGDLILGSLANAYYGEGYVLYGKAPGLDLNGDRGQDVLHGGSHEDTLRGGGGDDRLKGDLGNDTLRGGHGDDRVWGNAGNDRVYGGYGSDDLSGNAGDDHLFGRNGKDWLRGGTGADTLLGGAGDDKLRGGAGTDLLKGGTGEDRFIFGRIDETAAGAGDTIADFEAGDLLHLGRFDADTTTEGVNDAFSWIGADAFTGSAGELRFETSGSDLVVQGDLDGDGNADIASTLLGVPSLSAADFVL